MNIFLYMILFIIGAFCGSFAELTAYRMPLKISWKKKAFCENCNKALSIYDQIPILSYIMLKGKCRYCKNKISKSKIITEIIFGIAFIFLGLFYNLNVNTINIVKILEIILGGMYITFLAIIILIDLKNKTLNDQSIIFGIIISILNIIFKYVHDKEFRPSQIIVYMVIFIVIALISTLFSKKKNRHQYLFNNIFLILIMNFFVTEITMILTISTTLLIIGFKTILMKIYKKSTNEKIPISAYIGISNYIILLIIYIIENFR